MTYLQNKKRGFTLIELLITIAIIAILSGIVMTSMTSARSKSRDAKRISDLAQLQLALDQYFNRCNAYPISDDGLRAVGLRTSSGGAIGNCTPNPTTTLGDFISVIPTPPPQADQTYYQYYSKPDGTDYILQAKLEVTSLPESVSETYKVGAFPNSIGYNCYATSPYAAKFNYCVTTK